MPSAMQSTVGGMAQFHAHVPSSTTRQLHGVFKLPHLEVVET